jgi:hypothetical protein
LKGGTIYTVRQMMILEDAKKTHKKKVDEK